MFLEMIYMTGNDPERGENVHALIPINYLGHIRGTLKGLINIVKFAKVFRVKKRFSIPKRTLYTVCYMKAAFNSASNIK